MISRRAADPWRCVPEDGASPRNGRSKIAAAVLTLVMVAAACSGGDDDGVGELPNTEPATETVDADAGSSATTAGESAAGSSAASPEDGPEWLGSPINEAEARVNEFRRRVAEVGVSEVLAVAPSDRLVMYVQCPLPECDGALLGLDEAAELLGAQVDVVTHDGSEASVAAAWDEAVSASPDAVIGRLANPEWAAPSLDELASAGTPVVTWAADLAYEPGNGITANLVGADSHFFAGVLLADYIALASRDADDDVRVHYVSSDDVPVSRHVEDGFTTDINSSCPACTLTTEAGPTGAVATGVDGDALAGLVLDEGIDWVVFAHAGLVSGVVDAFEAAGVPAEVRIATTAGSPETFGQMASGRHVVADIGIAAEYLGWRSLDIIGRKLGDQAIGRAEQRDLAALSGRPDVMVDGMPVRYVEAGILDDPDEYWPGVDGFRNKFKELWGL